MGRRKKGTPPKLRRHKANKTAFVEVDGKRQYLGPWGSQEAARAYRQIISAWEREHAPGDLLPKSAKGTIAELISAFMLHAGTHYRRQDGSQTDEIRAFRRTLAPVLEKHGHESPDDFEPSDLESIMDAWVKAGHARETINKRAGRIKHVWAWGVSKKHVGALAAAALRMTPGLKSGRTPAPDYESVEVVPLRSIAAVLRFCKQRQARGNAKDWQKWPTTAAMIRVGYLCGARSSEICRMHTCEIHTKEFRIGKKTVKVPPGVWIFVPRQHKNLCRGKAIRYALGPKAQRILAPWIERAAGGFIFPGRDTPHIDNPKWNAAVALACKKLGIEHWSVGQLRHNYITRISHRYGIAAASESVSHQHISTTEVYAERNLKLSAEIAARHG